MASSPRRPNTFRVRLDVSLALMLALLALFSLSSCSDQFATDINPNSTDGDADSEFYVPPGGWADGDKPNDEPPPAIEVPEEVNFGAVLINTIEIKQLEIRNSGQSELKIDDFSLSDATSAEFSLIDPPSVPLSIAAGRNLLLDIQYAPTDEGRDEGSLLIYSQDPVKPVARVALVSEYKGSISVGVAPESVDFGLVAVDSEEVWMEVVISNGSTGASDNRLLKVSDIHLKNHPDAAFRLEGGLPFETLIAPNESFTFQVAFDPHSEGVFENSIVITNNAPGDDGGTIEVPLVAEAGVARLALDPEPIENTIDFGIVRIGESMSHTLGIKNVGRLPLHVMRLVLEEGSSPAFSLLDQSGQPLAADAQPDAIAEGESVAIGIAYAPDALRADVGMLIIESDSEGGEPTRTRVSLAGIGSHFAPYARPSSIDFGDVPLGQQSATRSFEIVNGGAAPLTVSGLAFAAATDSFSFSPAQGVTVVGATLAMGEAVAVEVVFSPQAAGAAQAAIVVSLTDSELAEISVPLTGNGIIVSDAFPQVTPPGPVDMGNALPNVTLSRAFKVTNGGNYGDLYAMGALVRNDPDGVFSVSMSDGLFPRPFTLRPGQNEYPFTLIFAPREAGEYAAELVVMTSTGEDTFDTVVAISATGLACPDTCWNLDENPNDCEYCGCTPGADPTEICDGLDNDCDGVTDNPYAFSLTSNCSPPLHASAYCDQGQCAFECDRDFHECDGACVYDEHLDHCGDSCTPCDEPENASAWCRDLGHGSVCGFDCDSGFAKIDGQCQQTGQTDCCGIECLDCYQSVQAPENGHPVCLDDACTFVCNLGYHLCGDQCVADADPAHCGSACDPCPVPENASAYCDGVACGFVCNEDYHLEGGVCVENGDVQCCGPQCEICSEAPENAFPVCTGLSCDFACTPGYHRCGDQCLADDSVASCGSACTPCGAPENASASCEAGVCGFECDSGFHLEAGQCLANEDPNCCGEACEVCVAPEHGSALCLDGACAFTCDEGFVESEGICIPDGSSDCCGPECLTCSDAPEHALPVCIDDACDFVCASGYHRCGDICVSLYDPNYCGSACETCAAPDNAQATCNGASCDFVCDYGFHEVDGVCVNNGDINCCGPECVDCPELFPSHTKAYCLEGQFCSYTCNQGYHKCGGLCVSNYSVYSCGHNCDPCPTLENGTALCVSGHCDLVCKRGFHMSAAGDACLPNDSLDCCGLDCTRCPSAVSDGQAVCEAGECEIVCNEGFHACSGACVADGSVNHCGESCAPCPTASNASPTCDGEQCGIACRDGYVLMDGACVPTH